MRFRSKFLILAALVLLVGTSLYAQGTTAALTGVVTSDGRPLPGATVTVASPVLQGTRTAITGETGAYNFPSLPPGRYSVTMELEGLQKVTRELTLSLAQTSRANGDLKVSAISEAITVTAGAPAVLETTQVATNFTSRQLALLPVGRTITSAVSLAPGVNAGIAGFSISGAASSENLYLVNGVVVNENLRGQPHNLFIEDAIQETTIITGSVSAEYGRFTGGVISTLTKSGGNEFTGSFRDGLSNADWTKKTPWPTEADHIDETNQVYEATLGGFVLRDRLWFFGAGRQAETAVQRFTSITNLPYTNGFDEKRYEAKLTGQVTPRHSLIGSYIDIKNDETNNAFSLVMDANSLVPVRSLPNTLASIQYNGVFTSNLLFEAAYADKYFAFQNSGSRFTDVINGTLIRDIPRGTRFWSPTFCGTCGDEERNNTSWLAKGSYFLDTSALGNHSLAFGVENFAEERLANNHQSGSDFRLRARATIVDGVVFPIFDSTTEIVWTPIFKSSTGTDFKTDSVFLNDKWDLNNHFGFNVGLRFDKNDGKDADGNTVSDDSAVSPRLSATYDIRGDGRQRLIASYSRYVAKIADGNVGGGAQSAGNPGYIEYAYGGPVVNAAGTPTANLIPTAQALKILFDWFNSVGGTGTTDPDIFIAADIPGFSARFNGPISSPRADEIALGYGFQIGRNAYLKFDAISRAFKDFYAFQLDQSTPQAIDQFGNESDVGFIINDNAIERDYRALQAQGSWRTGRFNIGTSYTLSELEGNDSSEGAATATSANTANNFYPEYLSYDKRAPKGRLPEDTRHRLRTWAGYEIPLPLFLGGWNVSVLHSYNSASPYSAVGSIDASGRRAGETFTGSPTNPGYTLSQLGTSHTYFFSDRGEFETADFNSTDFALQWEIPISRVQLYAHADLLNAFDNDALTNPNTNVRTRRSIGSSSQLRPFNPFTATPIECPQGAAASVCGSMNANWQKATTFGNPTGPASYQTPRLYRFSVGVRF